MQRQSLNETLSQNPLGEIAKILGFSAVARRSGVCHQSVSKWTKKGVGRESTDRVITASVEGIAQQIADLLAQHRNRTAPGAADQETVENFANVDA